MAITIIELTDLVEITVSGVRYKYPKGSIGYDSDTATDNLVIYNASDRAQILHTFDQSDVTAPAHANLADLETTLDAFIGSARTSSGGGSSENTISTANSTTDLLTGGATFTGVWEDVTNYTSVAVAVLGSLATDGILYFDVSSDGGATFNSIPAKIGAAEIWDIQYVFTRTHKAR